MEQYSSIYLGKLFSTIGLITTIGVIVKLTYVAYTFLRPSTLPKYLHNDKESYAFITGATDGTGLAFAHELAKHGFHLILHGRSDQKLQRVKAALNSKFPHIKTRIFLFDASQPIPPQHDVFDKLIQDLGDIHLTMLINNVGGMGCLPASALYKPFQSYTGPEVDTILNANVGFMTHLTRILIPLLDHGDEPSLILNMGSVASHGSPYVPIYSGTKGYVTSFTKSLDAEMKMEKKNIAVSVLMVGEVLSATNIVDTGLFVPTAEQFAASAVKRFGVGGPVIAGYWPHWLAMAFLDSTPWSVTRPLVMNTVAAKKAEHEKRISKRVD